MTRYAAFLRGVNLGKRTVKSADLVAAFAALGLPGARTLIASGNVLFDADDGQDLAKRIERGLAEAFGFEIGAVLRTDAALREMVQLEPFRDLAEDADAKRYVLLLDRPAGHTLALPYGVPGDFEVLSTTGYDIFAVAWHLPNGRYGEGLDKLEKRLPKGTLATMRNWNTILKAVG
ncbi:MAG: DUF1697 domain-containing protein [Devosia sp.]|nr:DUF1697 domain-containing protein [Devosia sp.]